ncbi:unnamed protein product [Choristocarpus tenellus]
MTRLIEVHGRLGLYKCVAEESGCPYAYDCEILPSAFPTKLEKALEGGENVHLEEIPRCPNCGSPSSPMALLFDEDYDSHSFYNFDNAQIWMSEADAIVFVGTSFAVTLTSLAVKEAKRRKIPVFDFNISASLSSSKTLLAKTVVGPAEETLPELAARAGSTVSPFKGGKATESVMTASVSVCTKSVGGVGCGEDGMEGTRTVSENGERNCISESEGEGAGKRPGKTCVDKLLPGSTKFMRTSDWSAVPEVIEPMEHSGTDGGDSEGEIGQEAGGGRTAGNEGMGFTLDPILTCPLSQTQVQVELSEAFLRKIYPDGQVEDQIETLWQEQLSKNPSIFNASKFRLAGYSYSAVRTAAPTSTPAPASVLASDCNDQDTPVLSHPEGHFPPETEKGSGNAHEGSSLLTLHLGLTDYRSFRGTNWSPNGHQLALDGTRDYSDPGAYLSNKLGVSALVETADRFLLALRRSGMVAEGQGLIGAPGGHPEPEKLGLSPSILRGLSRKEGEGGEDRRRLEAEAVRELFESARQEAVDETNVTPSELSEPLLMGITRQCNSNGTPTAAFLMQCSLGSVEVHGLYKRGAKEAFESTSLHTLPSSELLAEGLAWFTRQNVEATPALKGAVELWRRHCLEPVQPALQPNCVAGGANGMGLRQN